MLTPASGLSRVQVSTREVLASMSGHCQPADAIVGIRRPAELARLRRAVGQRVVGSRGSGSFVGFARTGGDVDVFAW